MEDVGVLVVAKVAIPDAPVRNRIRDPFDKLADTNLPVRGADSAVKIL